MRLIKLCIRDVRRLEYPMPASRLNRSSDETQPNDVDSSKALRVDAPSSVSITKSRIMPLPVVSSPMGRHPSDISICRLLIYKLFTFTYRSTWILRTVFFQRGLTSYQTVCNRNNFEVDSHGASKVFPRKKYSKGRDFLLNNVELSSGGLAFFNFEYISSKTIIFTTATHIIISLTVLESHEWEYVPPAKISPGKKSMKYIYLI